MLTMTAQPVDNSVDNGEELGETPPLSPSLRFHRRHLGTTVDERRGTKLALSSQFAVSSTIHSTYNSSHINLSLKERGWL